MSSVRSGTLSRVRPAKCTYLHTAVSILVVSALAVAGWAAVAVGGGASSESSESTLSQLRSASSQSVAHELEEAASAAVPPAETVVAESAVEISLPRPVVPVGPILPVATSVPPDSPMVGKFGLLCLPIMADITANRFPMSCTVSSEGGFSGEVEFSCLKL
ncbi:MAG: hypothetical protein QOE93_1458, partial [Actinomycetota bacterium]|nr:hypothetical protein [Actinomycetota bacterium]